MVDVLKRYFKVILGPGRKFKCLICGNDFSGTIANFRAHVWSMHGAFALEQGVEPPAGKTSKSLKTAQSSDRNLNDLHQPETSSNDISKYYEIVAGVDRRFKCMLCKNEFSGNFSNFRAHYLSIHKKVPKSFGMSVPAASKRRISDEESDTMSEDEPSENAYRYYEKLHNELLSFRCLLCNKELRGSRKNFDRHMWSMHKTEMEKIRPKTSKDKTNIKIEFDDSTNMDTHPSNFTSFHSETSQYTENETEEKASNYFEPISGVYRRFKCLICKNEYSGTYANFRGHMCSMHKQKAEALGVIPLGESADKNKPKREVFNGGKQFYEPMRGAVAQFNCLICGNTYKGSFANFRGHMWSMHKKVAKANGVVPLTSKQMQSYMSSDDDGDDVVSKFKRRKNLESEFTTDSSETQNSHQQEAVESFCRLCLQETQESTALFEFRNGKLVADLVLNIIPEISIQKHDDFSKWICSECLEIVTSACELRERTIENDRTMRSSIGNPLEFTIKEEPTQAESIVKFESEYDESHHQRNIDISDYTIMEVPTIKTERSKRSRQRSFDTADSFTISEFLQSSINPPDDAQHNEQVFTSSDDDACKTRKVSKPMPKKSHRRSCDNEIKCKVCNVKFKFRVDLTQHRFIHCDYVEEYQEPQSFECSLCAFQSDTDDEIQQHLLTHAAEFDLKPFLFCNKCRKTFEDFSSLVNHTNEHNEKITHRCLKCLKKFAYGPKLLRHLRQYKEAYVCDHCGHSDLNKQRFEDHIRVVHKLEICYLCPFCGESKSSHHALQNHIKVLHDKVRNYKCGLCPKSFASAAGYRNHQSVHISVSSFQCKKCPKMFKSFRNLKRHETFHDRTKLKYKHICDVEDCRKPFYTTHSKKRHMLTHTGIRPWICDYEGCDRSFSQSNDLNKHRRQHVGECTYKCDYPDCSLAFKYVHDLRIHQSDHYSRE